jgi:hypothetical protein
MTNDPIVADNAELTTSAAPTHFPIHVMTRQELDALPVFNYSWPSLAKTTLGKDVE